LHYGILLGSRACAHMAAAAWASGFLNALLHTANTFSLPLCQGNALGQFFCEVPQILKLSCSHSYLREIGLIVVSACLAFGCFIFIAFSYVQIFRAVLRIPSEQGRHKAFSTCLPHLAVVSLFISTSMFSYLKPPSISSPSLDLALSVLYCVVPPALNPLIYSLRNQELKDAVRKMMTGTWRRFPGVSRLGGARAVRGELVGNWGAAPARCPRAERSRVGTTPRCPPGARGLSGAGWEQPPDAPPGALGLSGAGWAHPARLRLSSRFPAQVLPPLGPGRSLGAALWVSRAGGDPSVPLIAPSHPPGPPR
ncbi:olfactory receptor 14J1-like, partial [Pithys albifrons albifrons]|uniref:olfactory receptor 14J1-like n=1 Tax=Pithys albifrons albifrons TaxID=3385563 RepID=UPI003A5CE49F